MFVEYLKDSTVQKYMEKTKERIKTTWNVWAEGGNQISSVWYLKFGIYYAVLYHALGLHCDSIDSHQWGKQQQQKIRIANIC